MKQAIINQGAISEELYSQPPRGILRRSENGLFRSMPFSGKKVSIARAKGSYGLWTHSENVEGYISEETYSSGIRGEIFRKVMNLR